MKDKRAFSLIELIAIIIIIGLILIVAIPAVTRLLKSNNNKQYEKYLNIVEAGALRYSEEAKDDLGGYKDSGCIEITLDDLIEEKVIKEYNEEDITCTGKIWLNNVKGNVKASINLTCKNKRNVITYEVKQIEENGSCIAYVPGDDETQGGGNITLVSKILSDNTAYADNVASPYVTYSTGIDFSKISSDTNGKGLYYTSTNTENNKPTYYFRGNVTNNYVNFAGFDWRIVRINEDGSVRIITQNIIGETGFNMSSSGDNAHVGYMYGTSGSSTYESTHANLFDSDAKDIIDNWYEENIRNNYSNYVTDAGFCNDRSIDEGLGYGQNDTSYGLRQFKCPQTNDLFTTNSSVKGNKSLTYPVGLLTATEVLYAGGISMIDNKNYYLYNGETYWTMTPSSYSNIYYGDGPDDVDRYVLVSAVDSDGELVSYDITTPWYGIRPVINLKSTVKISSELPSGCTELNGTKDCPYIIE